MLRKQMVINFEYIYIVEYMSHWWLFRQLRNERTSILFYLYTTSYAWKSGKLLRILAACILNVRFFDARART